MHQICFDITARRLLKKGMDQVADTAKKTLGPKGGYVVIKEWWKAPVITNDGAAIAKMIQLESPFENMGAELMKEVATKTNEVAGDGTTTAIVLAQALIEAGLKNLEAGVNPVLLNQGIQMAVDAALQAIRVNAQPISNNEQIYKIAATSVKDEAIGKLIAEAFDTLGPDCIIEVEPAETMQNQLEIKEGALLPKGYLSAQMINTPEKSTVVFAQPAILIADRKFHTVEDILPIMEKVVQDQRPLLMIVEELKGEALRLINVNNAKGIIQIAAIGCPAFGENRYQELGDYGALIGAYPITANCDIATTELSTDFYGSAEKVVITKNSCLIIGGNRDKNRIIQRTAEIKAKLEAFDSEFARKIGQERLRRLAGSVAVLKICAPTEAELHEKRLRIEDGIHAVRAAIKEGVICGGGTAYIDSLLAVNELYCADIEMQAGIEAVKHALCKPLYQIATNAGRAGALVVEKVKQAPIGIGYNVQKDCYEEFLAAGIIDPVKVPYTALRNAASIAELVLTTAVVIDSV